ncbi:MAG: sugar transporter permease [Bacilli bacterium]|nr:sugar transporter permease [Bacilli bacterium]
MPSSTKAKTVSYMVILLLIVVYLFPLLFVLNTSFKTVEEFLISPLSISTRFHWHNYVEAWSQGKFSIYIWNSIYYTVVSTFFTILLSMFAAFPVARKYIWGSTFFYLFFVSAQFLPNPVVAQFRFLLSTHLYNSQIGYILLRTSGAGVIFMLFVGYVKSISRDLDEAAGIDGCGYFQFLFKIAMPLMKPIIATGVILSAIGTWNDLILPTQYLSDSSKWPITAALINFQGQYGNNFPLLACGTVIIGAPIVVLYIFIQRYLIDGALAGAVK